MPGYFRSKFDRTGDSSAMGENAENQFVKIAKSKGYEVIKSNNWQDAVGHYDYTLKLEDSEYKVEVKARKKLYRGAADGQSEWIWVEFKNINGNKGWIYGKADRVAFELDNNYIVVNRQDLADLAEKLVDRNTFVLKSQDAKYKAYKRKDRPNEMVGLINIDDLRNIKHVIWDKVV